MSLKPLLLPVAAALALGSIPALAQHGGHDHGGHHPTPEQQAAAAKAGIVEGKLEKGVRVFHIAVTEDGFEPSRLKVHKGEKVRFVVTRRTNRTCATEIVIRDHGIEKPLPLDKPVTVEFTPARSGEIRYACGMNHVSGIAFVP